MENEEECYLLVQASRDRSLEDSFDILHELGEGGVLLRRLIEVRYVSRDFPAELGTS